jgi:hypothetical protein
MGDHQGWQINLKTAIESLLKRHAAGFGISESLCLVTRARLQSGRKYLKIKVGFSPSGMPALGRNLFGVSSIKTFELLRTSPKW